METAARSKSYVHMSFKLRSDIAERLGNHRSETGVPMTFTVERALEQYLGMDSAATKQQGRCVPDGIRKEA